MHCAVISQLHEVCHYLQNSTVAYFIPILTLNTGPLLQPMSTGSITLAALQSPGLAHHAPTRSPTRIVCLCLQVLSMTFAQPGVLNSGAVGSIFVVIDQYMAETAHVAEHNVAFS